MEEGPGCVQSTLYPRAECRQATVPTRRSTHRAASLHRYSTSRRLLHHLCDFIASGGEALFGAESALERIWIKTGKFGLPRVSLVYNIWFCIFWILISSCTEITLLTCNLCLLVSSCSPQLKGLFLKPVLQGSVPL